MTKMTEQILRTQSARYLRPRLSSLGSVSSIGSDKEDSDSSSIKRTTTSSRRRQRIRRQATNSQCSDAELDHSSKPMLETQLSIQTHKTEGESHGDLTTTSSMTTAVSVDEDTADNPAITAPETSTLNVSSPDKREKNSSGHLKQERKSSSPLSSFSSFANYSSLVLIHLLDEFFRVWLVYLPRLIYAAVPSIDSLVSYVFVYILLQALGILWGLLVNGGIFLALGLIQRIAARDSFEFTTALLMYSPLKAISTLYVIYATVRFSVYFGQVNWVMIWESLKDFPRTRRLILRDRRPRMYMGLLLFMITAFTALLLVIPQLCGQDYTSISRSDSAINPRQHICQTSFIKYLTPQYPISIRALRLALIVVFVQWIQVLMYMFPSWADAYKEKPRAGAVISLTLLPLIALTAIWFKQWLGDHVVPYPYHHYASLYSSLYTLFDGDEGSNKAKERVKQLGWDEFSLGLLLLWELWFVLLLFTGQRHYKLATAEQDAFLRRVFKRLKLSLCALLLAHFVRGCLHPKHGFLGAQQELTILTLVLPFLYIAIYSISRSALRVQVLISRIFFLLPAIVPGFVTLLASCGVLSYFLCGQAGITGPTSYVVVFFHLLSKILRAFGESVSVPHSTVFSPSLSGISEYPSLSSLSSPLPVFPPLSPSLGPILSETTVRKLSSTDSSTISSFSSSSRRSSQKVQSPLSVMSKGVSGMYTPTAEILSDSDIQETDANTRPKTLVHASSSSRSVTKKAQELSPLEEQKEVEMEYTDEEVGNEEGQDKGQLLNSSKQEANSGFRECTKSSPSSVESGESGDTGSGGSSSGSGKTRRWWLSVKTSREKRQSDGKEVVRMWRKWIRKPSARNARSSPSSPSSPACKRANSEGKNTPANAASGSDAAQNNSLSDPATKGSQSNSKQDGANEDVWPVEILARGAVRFAVGFLYFVLICVASVAILSMIQSRVDFYPNLMRFTESDTDISLEHVKIIDMVLDKNNTQSISQLEEEPLISMGADQGVSPCYPDSSVNPSAVFTSCAASEEEQAKRTAKAFLKEVLKKKEPTYAACNHNWFGLSLFDFALLAELAYIDPNHMDVSKGVQMFFPPEKSPEIKVRLPSPEVTKGASAQFFEAFIPEYNLSVIAIRGTDVGRIHDFVEDVKMYVEPVIFVVLSAVFPTIRIWPDTTTSTMIEFFHEMLMMFGLEHKVWYYHQIIEYIKDIDDRNVVMTGHSLAGGLARVVGSMLGIPAVVFSAPGMAQSYKKLVHTFGNWTSQVHFSRLHHLNLNVLPDHDIVHMIDGQSGLLQRITCDTSHQSLQNSCHMMEGTICNLFEHCGDPRGRFTSCRYDYNLVRLASLAKGWAIENLEVVAQFALQIILIGLLFYYG